MLRDVLFVVALVGLTGIVVMFAYAVQKHGEALRQQRGGEDASLGKASVVSAGEFLLLGFASIVLCVVLYEPLGGAAAFLALFLPMGVLAFVRQIKIRPETVSEGTGGGFHRSPIGSGYTSRSPSFSAPWEWCSC
jgi:hypothetical protein